MAERIEIFLPDAPNIEIDFCGLPHCALPTSRRLPALVLTGSADSLLQKVESEKDNLHLGPCARKGNIFFPCVVTTFGQFGSRSRKLIGKLAGRACHRYPDDCETPGMWARHFKTTMLPTSPRKRQNGRRWLQPSTCIQRHR